MRIAQLIWYTMQIDPKSLSLMCLLLLLGSPRFSIFPGVSLLETLRPLLHRSCWCIIAWNCRWWCVEIYDTRYLTQRGLLLESSTHSIFIHGVALLLVSRGDEWHRVLMCVWVVRLRHGRRHAVPHAAVILAIRRCIVVRVLILRSRAIIRRLLSLLLTLLLGSWSEVGGLLSEWLLTLSWSESLRWLLGDWASASDSFNFLDS